MRELKTEFDGRGQVKGFKFTQIEKSSNVYLYEVKSGSQTHYEIFKRKENTRFNCVSYPSNKAFGIWAWTFKKLETARELFDDLCDIADSDLIEENY